MNMNVKTPVMDWTKYTIDGWLEQFGAWCETVNMRGGDLPDGLHVNQIYWLMQDQKKLKPKSRGYIYCEINDYEADQIQAILRSVLSKAEPVVKFALMCLIKHKVENRTLISVSEMTKQSKQMTHMMINCARFHLNGYDKRLKIE